MKKIDASALIGDSGIALIHTLVNKRGFAWHERKLDAGIDGEIELRNPATGEVANRIVLVQSKASERPFPGETEPDPRTASYRFASQFLAPTTCLRNELPRRLDFERLHELKRRCGTCQGNEANGS